MHKIAILLLMTFVLSFSGFQPVSDGNILWLSTTQNGGYVLVSHYHEELSRRDYLKVARTSVITDTEGMILEQELLPGTPTSFAISGCGHNITVAVTIEGMTTIYVDYFYIPNNIVCGNSNAVYIPIASTP